MMQPERTTAFKGVALDSAPHAIPDGYYQADEGGDRYFRGVWRRRRGMLRTNLAKFSAAGTSILGFKAPGTDFATGADYAVMVASGALILGFGTVGEQTF